MDDSEKDLLLDPANICLGHPAEPEVLVKEENLEDYGLELLFGVPPYPPLAPVPPEPTVSRAGRVIRHPRHLIDYAC